MVSAPRSGVARRSGTPRSRATEFPAEAKLVEPTEGLDETLTVLTLELSPQLRRSLSTTNAVESLISRTRLVKRNVKRWRGGPAAVSGPSVTAFLTLATMASNGR